MQQVVSIGLDLGGTSFGVGWLGADGRLGGLRQLETHSYRPRDEIISDMAEAIRQTAQQAEAQGLTVSGVGVGVPAVIDPWEGRVLLPPNFADGWHGFPLALALEAKTGLPTVLINDARAFTFAEARLGAGKGAQHVLGITLGTGVGGGLVLNGELYLGRWGTAGEFGHQVVEPNGVRCGCGGFGCIEAYASGPAIVGAGVRPLRQGRMPILRELISGKLDDLTPKEVAEAAQRGEEECLEIYAQAGRAVGIGISNVLSLLGLGTVVIGGGIAEAGKVLFDPIWATVRRHQYMVAEHLSELKIVPAELEEPGVLGAAVWAREHAQRPDPNGAPYV